MIFQAVIDMTVGIVLAFSAVYFWQKKRGDNAFFLFVMAALFNYFYSFFRVLENIKLIPENWYLAIGSFPIVKFLIIIFSMLFLLMGIILFASSKKDKIKR